MKRPRYWRVWQQGYNAGAKAATSALIRHLEAGGQIAVTPFSKGLAIRHSSGLIAEAGTLLALAAFDPDAPQWWREGTTDAPIAVHERS